MASFLENLFGSSEPISPYRREDEIEDDLLEVDPFTEEIKSIVSKNDSENINNSIGFSDDQWSKFKDTIAGIESGNKYDIKGGANKHYDGKYQLGRDAKADAASVLGLKNPGHDRISREEFRKDPEQQEKFFDAFTKKNHSYLMQFPKYKKASPERKLEILGYAHNQGMGGAAKWLESGEVKADAFGTKGTRYVEAIRKRLESNEEDGPKRDNSVLSNIGNILVPSAEAGESIQTKPERQPMPNELDDKLRNAESQLDSTSLYKKLLGIGTEEQPEEEDNSPVSRLMRLLRPDEQAADRPMEESMVDPKIQAYLQNLDKDQIPVKATTPKPIPEPIVPEPRTADMSGEIRDPFTQDSPIINQSEVNKLTTQPSPEPVDEKQAALKDLFTQAAGGETQYKSDLQKAIDERKDMSSNASIGEAIAQLAAGFATTASGQKTPVNVDLSNLRKMGEAGVEDVELKRKASEYDPTSKASIAAQKIYSSQFDIPIENIKNMSAADLFKIGPQIASRVTKQESLKATKENRKAVQDRHDRIMKYKEVDEARREHEQERKFGKQGFVSTAPELDIDDLVKRIANELSLQINQAVGRKV